MAARHYRRLTVRHKATALVAMTCDQTRSFPGTERFGRTSPLRRAAASIPSPVAEGEGPGNGKACVPFLGVAYGLLQRMETQVSLAQRGAFVTEAQTSLLLNLAGDVGRLIHVCCDRGENNSRGL